MRSRITVAALLMAVLMVVPGCSSNGSAANTSSSTQVSVKMLMSRVQPEVAGSFKVGQQVRAKDTGALVGSIVSVEPTLAVVSLGDSEGQLHDARSPILRDVVLTVEGEAVESESGYEFDGAYRYINQEMVFLTPYTQFLGIIISMERAKD